VIEPAISAGVLRPDYLIGETNFSFDKYPQSPCIPAGVLPDHELINRKEIKVKKIFFTILAVAGLFGFNNGAIMARKLKRP